MYFLIGKHCKRRKYFLKFSKLQEFTDLYTLFNIGYILNETDTDVCMYTLRKLFLCRCGHIAVQVEYGILNVIYTGLYTNVLIDLNRQEKL